jgi:hypothetical protein
MTVNKERVALIPGALRSGEYEQGQHWLHKDGKWCCLGVACDIAAKAGLVLSRSVQVASGAETFDGQDGYLPSSVMQWYGFDSSSPLLDTPHDGQIPASVLNDGGYFHHDGEPALPSDFAQIARYFEDTFLKDEP